MAPPDVCTGVYMQIEHSTRAVAQRRAARELEEPESSSFSSPLLCPFEKVPGPIPCPAPLQRLLPPAVSPTCTALSQSPPDNATDGAAGFMGDIKGQENDVVIRKLNLRLLSDAARVPASLIQKSEKRRCMR